MIQLQALTYQACLPIFFVFAVMTYSIGQLNLYHHPILEYSTFILAGIVPALSPITSFRFIHPYRTWIRKELLRRHSTAAMVSETSISVLQRSFVFRRGRRDLWNSRWFIGSSCSSVVYKHIREFVMKQEKNWITDTSEEYSQLGRDFVTPFQQFCIENAGQGCQMWHSTWFP